MWVFATPVVTVSPNAGCDSTHTHVVPRYAAIMGGTAAGR